MNFLLAIPGRQDGTTWREFFWLHPEWWTVGLCGVAWALLLWHGLSLSGHLQQHHELHGQGVFAGEVWRWMLMVAAMMLPLVIDRVQATAEKSLWKRRHRAIAGFLAGYLLPWLLLGIGVGALRQISWTHSDAAPALSFVVAVLWHQSWMHRRALAVCHRIQPLAPVGWRADLDCLRFGSTVGAACVCSCWPLMLGCAFTGHSLIAMCGGMAVGAAERWWHIPHNRVPLYTALALASYYVLFALMDRGVTTAA